MLTKVTELLLYDNKLPLWTPGLKPVPDKQLNFTNNIH